MITFGLPEQMGGLSYLSFPHGHSTERKPVTSFGGSSIAIPDGTRVDFYTRNKFRSGALYVFVNGLLQEKDREYEEHLH